MRNYLTILLIGSIGLACAIFFTAFVAVKLGWVDFKAHPEQEEGQ